MLQDQAEQPARRIPILQIVLVVIIIIALALFIAPFFLRQSRPAHKAQATSNAKEIGSALIGFIDLYGGYPSQSTLQQLRDEGIEVLPIGNDANSYLGQLLAADCVDSEKIFYVKGISSREGDNIYSAPEKMLAQGENGFGYVMLKGDEPLSGPFSEDLPPVIVAPLKTGGSNPTFDLKPFKGQYIYLTPDGAVSGGKISKDGKPITARHRLGGLFESGQNSVFGTGIPDVKMPR